MAHCVNRSSEEFKALAEQSNINPIILAAKVSLWQEENGLDKFPTVDTLFQLRNERSVESAIKELDSYLLDFMKPFGVRSKEFDELKSKLGVDALGATDVLNKLIWYTKNRNAETIPEEVGHMATMLMGENHPDIKDLLSEIENWSEYQEIYNQYMPIYNNEKQVKIEAIGKLIAKSLVKNYKESGFDKTLLQKAIDVITKFINNMLTATNIGDALQYNSRVADHIALNILVGNKDYIANLKPATEKLDYKKALEGNPFAQKIISFFTSKNMKLTGSIAIAGQGEVIYRSSAEPIHDIDFNVNSFDDFASIQEDLMKMNAEPYHYGWDNKQKDYKTFAFLIPKKGFRIEVLERDFVRGNGWITNYNVLNEKGEIVKPTSQNHLAVDFFVYKNGQQANSNSIFKSFADIFFGKLTLSSEGNNERMFKREKDQIDYVLSKPKNIVETDKAFRYLQTEEMPASKASPETLDKVKDIIKAMGVEIQDLATYMKETGLTNPNLNGVADLVRGIITIAEGKEDVALTEEMVHIATSIINLKNPQMVTEMISKIDRFEIYNRTLNDYKNDPAYQLPNGKPDIRKIKKEAVDKLIAELIINESEGSTEFPELLDETNRSIIRRWWDAIVDFFRGQYRKSNINIFGETARLILNNGVEGNVLDLDSKEIYYQLTDAQKNIQEKLEATKDNLKKVESGETADPLLLDEETANNWYEILMPDGSWQRVTKRVTDRVKAWYKQRFGNKAFTEEEKAFNELKRDLGIKGHGYFEEIHDRYFNSDGTRKEVIEDRPYINNSVDKDVYDKIEKYYTDLIASFSKEGKNPLVFSEVKIYDAKEKEAGTIDLLIVEENGKANIFDWKFMSVAPGAKDVAWYKQGAYNVQLGRYKEILRDNYGVREFGMNRAIPIIMDIKRENPKDQSSAAVLKGIAIGSVNTADIEDVRLIPVSEESESTGFESLDGLIRKLNAVYRQISKKDVTDEEEREFKRERMNILKTAIRTAQSSLNIAPLVDVIKIMRKEGQEILDDYKTTYEGRPATSEDFNDSQLSDFAENMREYMATADVFGRIDDLIGDLIYTAEMEKNATTAEQKEEISMRKDLLFNITQEAKLIRASEREITRISGEFADKFIGQRNLVTGLTKAEAVVKGLSSTFRGISDLPLASLQILYKLVINAKGMASQKALGEVNELMAIRKRLVDRGGDVRKLVQEIYQKDSEGKLVNKLIYRFDRKFYETVDSNALEGNKEWLLDNIDVKAYKQEALKIMNERIAKIKKIYSEDEDLREKLIYEEERKWDIDREDFNGFDNYVIKRHPLAKWESQEYKNIKKDADLLALYNFITKINSKAKDAGYISNKLSSTFLPFVRKGMAESFAWDFSLSAIKNFGTNLSIQADDVGYGSVNELTGELENSIPKYYTYDFTRGEDGVNDYSDVSEDIFKNMILYINHMEKYTYLSDVEGQLQLVKTIETFKDHLNTSRTGDVVIKDGKPEELKGNEENTKLFNDFLRALLYEQKYPLSDSDIPLGLGKVSNFMKEAVNKVAGREVFTIDDTPSATSLVKTMDAANRAFQLKTLGFEFISGAVNLFGANIQVATQAGNYFKAREFAANEGKLIGNRFKNDDDREMFIQMIDKFMPLKDDPTYDKLKESGLSALTRQNFSDMLMIFMREPEQHVEKSIFLTLLQNMMIEDGKIVSIREFVKNKYKGRFENAQTYRDTKKQIDAEIEELKKTRSIDAIKTLEDGKLVIPGLDLNNATELQRFTNLTRRISRNATGGLSDSDMNRMGMNIWTKSMMVFKNWIPKLVDTRFSELRRVSDDFSVTIDEDGISEGDKYDIGRVRLWAYVMGTSIRDRSSNIYNILSMNDKGLAVLDQMYEEFSEKYEKRTGKPFNMTKEDFIDMIKNNLRNEAKELAILLSLFGMMFSLGFVAPDDDDDKATKNFYRYTQRVIDKFIGELSFFYNPVEFQKILSGGMFPAIGIFSDIERFVSHTTMEVTGYDISDPELTSDQVRKKAQPVKNAAKMFPFTKSLMTYGAIFDSEFAKEYDITIQKESRR